MPGSGLGLRSKPLKAALGVCFVAGALELAAEARENAWAMKLGLHPDARAALKLHCGELAGAEGGECRAYLREKFARDESHAQSIIRLHCTRIETVWESGPRAPAPPPCAERFGGWIRG